MSLYVVGFSHSTAPLPIRERFALEGDNLSDALYAVRSHAAEATIVSTCNRFELYAVLRHGQRPEKLLKATFGQGADDLRDHTYAYHDQAAVRHLFRVACGLDSLVVGEVQILGQVQRAWQAAHKAGTAGPLLSQLFHRAVTVAKRVQSETGISRNPASVSYAAVVLARQIFGAKLADRRALVIGTGEVGEGVARCLYDHGVHATVVAHRQLERAAEVARRYHADTAQWHDLATCLRSADIVISSTAAPHYILQRIHVEEAMSSREGRPLYLIDLAVPRDIEPGVAEIQGVHLHNVDDLRSVVRATLEQRQSALPEIERIISAETLRFMGWLKARSTAPTIKELQEQAANITRSEVNRALLKLPDLDEHDRRVVEVMAQRIAGKLIHGPINWLKAQAESLHAGEAEPDYGMSNLSPAEVARLFYRDIALEENGPELRAHEDNDYE